MLGVQHVESGYPEPIGPAAEYGWMVVEIKLVCDWESTVQTKQPHENV